MAENETRIIFVGCLRPKTTEDELIKAFSTIAPVEDVTILRHPNGRSKQVAFISYATPEIARQAVEKYDETKQCNCIVHVELRKSRQNLQSQYQGHEGRPVLFHHSDSYSDTEPENMKENQANNETSIVEKQNTKKHHRRRHHRSYYSSYSSDYSDYDRHRSRRHRHHRHHRRHHHRSKPSLPKEEEVPAQPTPNELNVDPTIPENL